MRPEREQPEYPARVSTVAQMTHYDFCLLCQSPAFPCPQMIRLLNRDQVRARAMDDGPTVVDDG
jgi:hypothetical protein